ncbi:hypothetical protein L915_16847 [Phytophthora nicotianae]|uniref:Uncharacterized protein n=1 Tax=Phytophthora nicotianae TaxID=4792 RepID=W2G1K1_PHYNI|nr:hypothetical protein L915_16847 [Phytophthora nicotianae]
MRRRPSRLYQRRPVQTSESVSSLSQSQQESPVFGASQINSWSQQNSLQLAQASPEGSELENLSSRTSQPRDPSTETEVSQPAPEGVSEEPFAWTTRAADALLRVRFESMAYRFGGAKSSAQLRAAWIMVAAEVSRLGGIVIKYMQKQYTEYRVDQCDTGNRTEISLREPACYGTMCEVWGNMTGMQSEAFYSSDTRLQQQPAPDNTAENAADNTGNTEGGNSSSGQDEAGIGRQRTGSDTSSSDRRQGWRANRPSKRHKTVTLAEGMLAEHDGMLEIAEAFTASKAPAPPATTNTNNAILQSLHTLTESVQAQTNILTQLVHLVTAANTDTRNQQHPSLNNNTSTQQS